VNDLGALTQEFTN